MSDEEISKEKPTRPEHEQGSEQLSAATGLSADAEQQAISLVEQVLAEPFASFNPDAYNQHYYGEIKPEVAGKIGELIQSVEQTTGNHSLLELDKLRQALAPVQLETTTEILENAAIYDFVFRKVLPTIIRQKPDDHLKVLDVGGGPSVYQHIPLMGISDSITHAEYALQNREAVKQWQRGEGTFSWETYFDYFGQYLTQHPDVFSAAEPDVQQRLQGLAAASSSELESELRARLTSVVPVNIFRDDLGLVEDEGYDLVDVSAEGDGLLVTSNFCIESATPSRDDWERGISNVAARVAPGGFLLMTAIRNAQWYQVGEERMPAVPIVGKDLETTLSERDFEILELTEMVGSDSAATGYDGMIFLLARKKASLA